MFHLTELRLEGAKRNLNKCMRDFWMEQFTSIFILTRNKSNVNKILLLSVHLRECSLIKSFFYCNAVV